MPRDYHRERRSRSNRQPAQRLTVLNMLNNQRVVPFCLVAMLIVIFEFQGIHEARVQHKKLRDLHLQEQSMLQTIEKDVMAVVHQASDALVGGSSTGASITSDETTQNPLHQEHHSLRQERHPQHQQTEEDSLASLQQQHQEPSQVTRTTSTEPIQHVAANSEEQLIPPSPKTAAPTPRPESQWNLPAPSTKPKDLIPITLEQLADLSDPYSKVAKEVPFFFHIAKAGGTSVKNMYSDCYGLVEACESGVTENHLRDITLKVVTLESGWKFLNVDTTTPLGLERAARFHVARSGKADLVVSPLPHDVTPQLFIQQHKGRMFTILRDPLERVVSLFYYLQKATHEPTYNPALKSMTFEEYVRSDLAESNFMSRTLINKMEAAFVEQDFEVAKEILRTKCLVGLLDHLEESVRRFDMYFGFVEAAPIKPDPTCTAKYLKTGTNRHSHPSLPAPGTPLHDELLRKNHMDVRLFAYAKELFAEQAAIFESATTATS